MSDFDNKNDNLQQPIKPTEIGRRSRLSSSWFWRKKVEQELEKSKVYEYVDEDYGLQEKQKLEQQKQIAVDKDRNSRGTSPPIIMNQSETATEVMAAPKEKKKKKISFRKLIKRRIGGGNKKR